MTRLRESSLYIITIISLVVTLGLFINWFISEHTNEPLIGIVTTTTALVAFFLSQEINYLYLKYYVETHKTEGQEDHFYTLVAIWSNSTKRIGPEDFNKKSDLPTLKLLSGVGEITGVSIIDKPKKEPSNFKKKLKNEFVVDFNYLHPNDYFIIKFSHTNASLLETRRIEENEYVEIFKIDVELSGKAKGKETIEQVHENDFYIKRFYDRHLTTGCFVAIIGGLQFLVHSWLPESWNTIWSTLVLGICLYAMLILPFIDPISKLIRPRKIKMMMKAFKNAGGKNYKTYIEYNGGL